MTMFAALVVAALAQASASLHVTVVDPSGAVIVGAHVSVAGTTVDTGARGEAAFDGLEPGRYTIHVESPGFDTRDLRNERVRAGDNRREVKLSIAKLAETVQVGRDPQVRASDPRNDAFATILGQAEINELPDDPDEMEQMLRDMAGPGAVMRVNGFRGGRLPPKDQIQQIRFRRNMFAADAHEPGFVSVDITIFLDDYKTVSGVQLPHHITRSIDGKPTEELTFKTITVNPAFKPDTFSGQ